MWLYLGKDISKDWSVDNMKKTRLNGYVYNFSVDYDAIAADDISNIYMYLMKKKKKKHIKMFGFITKVFFTGLTISSTLSSANLLKCISMNNQ